MLAHPECPPEVVAECDFTGSTAAMADYVGTQRPAKVVLLTECSMSDNVALQYPDLDFVRPCNLCPHMKRITLPNIRHALETMTHEVTVAPGDRRAGAAAPSSACWRSAEIGPPSRPSTVDCGRGSAICLDGVPESAAS